MVANTRFSIAKNMGLLATITSIALMILTLFGLVLTSKSFNFLPHAVDAEGSEVPSVFVSEFEENQDSEKEMSVDVKDVGQLRALYASLEFDLFREGANLNQVPRVYVTSLPKDLKKIHNVEDKKQLFVQVLLPMILAENEKIVEARKHLITVRESMLQGEKLTSEDQEWLADLIQRYKLKDLSMDELIRRVDFIPPSLALGQAILETGWGVSFAALEKNSPFGYTIRDRVKFYESLQKSIEDYILNLNTHHAYKRMRLKRAELRDQKKPICSFQLVETLHHYSELGLLYINRVKNLMKMHGLGEFDRAKLVSMSQRS